MRFLFLALLLTAACSDQGAPVTNPGVGTFTSGPRDLLCIAERGQKWRVGVIGFGEGNNNCTLKADVVTVEHGILVEAIGDPECRFFIESDGSVLTFPAKLPGACSYYCGPGASLAGKKFTSSQNAGPVTDFGGDSLC